MEYLCSVANGWKSYKICKYQAFMDKNKVPKTLR